MYQTMLDSAAWVLRAGYSVILDATFLQSSYRALVHNLAASEEVKLLFYWLDIDHALLPKRILDTPGWYF